MMPGARIPIEDPEILSQRRTDYLLLLPWNLKDEIVRQQEKYLNDGGIIIVPAPRIELIDKQALHQ